MIANTVRSIKNNPLEWIVLALFVAMYLPVVAPGFEFLRAIGFIGLYGWIILWFAGSIVLVQLLYRDKFPPGMTVLVFLVILAAVVLTLPVTQTLFLRQP